MNTLNDKIALHRDKIRNWTVANLKADKDFMRDCRDDPEFRGWCLSQRADLKREPNPYKVKFKKREKFVPEVVEETKPEEPEPVEKLSKTAQLIKDVFKYRDTKFMK